MQTKTHFMIFLALGALLASAADVSAVAFKVHNQTDLKFRMRVKDRGEFRPWAEMPPGYWQPAARDVERADHEVEVDVWTAKDGKEQWVEFYRGKHGSHTLTRVAHLFKAANGAIVLAWHDEPPGCRDKPEWNGQQVTNGCLVESGWQERVLYEALEKVAKEIVGTAIKAIFIGS